MKKKSLSHDSPARLSLSTRNSLVQSFVGQGGFFVLRILISVLLCFAGITLVFLVLGKVSAQPRKPLDSASKIAPWVIDHTANGQRQQDCREEQERRNPTH